MTNQKAMDSVKTLQRKHLSDLNTHLFPKFQQREEFLSLSTIVTNPLSKEIIADQITTLRNEIAVEFIREAQDLIDAICYSWNNNFAFGDAQSFVYENVLDAIKRYKTTNVPFCKFSTFFWMHNQNLLRNQAKKLRADKWDIRKTYSLDAIVSSNDAESGTSYESLIVTDKSYDTHVARIILKELYGKSTPKQKKVLKRLYLGYTQSEIARQLGVTGTNINTVIRKLREELKK